MRTRTIIAFVVLSFVAAACGARFKGNGGVVGAGAGSATDANGAVDAGTGDQSLTGDTTTGDTAGVGVGAGGTGTGSGTRTATTAGSGASGSSAAIGSTQGVTATDIQLGYLLPISGAAPVPQNVDRGVNAYWDYINNKGGINGRKVHPHIEDTQSDANVGRDKAKKLIETDKVFAIVVLDRLENQQAIGDYLEGRHFPNIEIQTPANLSKSYSWTFGVTIDHAIQGTLIADYFVKKLGDKDVNIVYENTPALAPGRDAFKAEMAKLGGSVKRTIAINGNDNDYSSQAQDLATSGAKATWLYMAPTPAAKLATQADTLGYHPTWFANSISWQFNLALKAAPTALRGARAFSPWLPLTDPRTNTYQQAYRASNNNATPDDLGLVGWGVGEIVGEGLQRTGKSLGQNAFRAAMQALTFKPDMWAPVTFGPGVREGSNAVAVLRVAAGATADHWELDSDFVTGF